MRHMSYEILKVPQHLPRVSNFFDILFPLNFRKSLYQTMSNLKFELRLNYIAVVSKPGAPLMDSEWPRAQCRI